MLPNLSNDGNKDETEDAIGEFQGANLLNYNFNNNQA